MKYTLFLPLFIVILVGCTKTDLDTTSQDTLLPTQEQDSWVWIDVAWEEEVLEIIENIDELVEWNVYDEDYPISEDIILDMQLAYSWSISSEELGFLIGQTRREIEESGDWDFAETILERSLHIVRYIEIQFPENIENLRLYGYIYERSWMLEKALYQHNKILEIDETNETTLNKLLQLNKDLGVKIEEE
jgi:tetratricopeptide (TPR) repeat protein